MPEQAGRSSFGGPDLGGAEDPDQRTDVCDPCTSPSCESGLVRLAVEAADILLWQVGNLLASGRRSARGGVAPRLHAQCMRPRRALPAGRSEGLGAAADLQLTTLCWI